MRQRCGHVWFILSGSPLDNVFAAIVSSPNPHMVYDGTATVAALASPLKSHR
eukprot:CAMPEP_0172525988 /NCGR_PEP_ID=MMETSP1067-20121228/1007_1 /TAXON_ID=265564 ORGANISM="Thalassiosira punctigera, Strain Tpunct2005C2" /NCGR_SAMPLE_ID=MMETSP1067 /ASSEMBLY_ACC=CAM_ASM_000444 /LENGTH=51 /DNA_ID=CAMNT_0013309395 /DNA_START=315 /DNA_END=467 /DNA_ORIENTATION=+